MWYVLSVGSNGGNSGLQDRWGEESDALCRLVADRCQILELRNVPSSHELVGPHAYGWQCQVPCIQPQ